MDTEKPESLVIEAGTLSLSLSDLVDQLVQSVGDERNRRPGQPWYAPLVAFVAALDERVGEWEFTTELLMVFQGQFDELEKAELEQGWRGDLTRDAFLRMLENLDKLTPEGDVARKHFGTMSKLAEQARNYVPGSEL